MWTTVEGTLVFGKRPIHSELEIAVARQRSFVGAAMAVFVLYWFCYLPGLLFNIMWLSEAGRVRRVIGTPPAGTGCLQAMLLIGAIPLVFFGFVFYTSMMLRLETSESSSGGIYAARSSSFDPSRVYVKNARVDLVEREFGENPIYARFEISNNSDVTLTSAEFWMEYKTPGRAVAWNKGEGEAYFEGGIEPGETRSVEFLASGAPSVFSIHRFRVNELREDAELLVDIRSVQSIPSIRSESRGTSETTDVQLQPNPAADIGLEAHPYASDFEDGASEFLDSEDKE
jgi:hypothetical protein